MTDARPKHSPARSSMFTSASKPQASSFAQAAASQLVPAPAAPPAIQKDVKPKGDETLGWKRLKGKYLTFFAVEHHRDVERWYNTAADKQQRGELKHLVHAILGFDFATEKKRRLRLVTNEPDIVGANALLNANGVKYFSSDAKLRAVEFLSLATVADKNAFRNVFGRIVPPSLFASSRSYECDYDPSRKFWKPDNMIGGCKDLIGKSHTQRPSFPIDAPAEVVGFASKTNHDQCYVWKLPKKSQAPVSGGPDAGPAPAVIHNALQSSCDGAPWGSLDVGNIDGRQWRSVTNEHFDNSVFMLNPATRHFQNYNENYCRLLSTAVRIAKRKKSDVDGDKKRPASTLPEISKSTAAIMSPDHRPASCLP
jgi:hypothetical protein